MFHNPLLATNDCWLLQDYPRGHRARERARDVALPTSDCESMPGEDDHPIGIHFEASRRCVDSHGMTVGILSASWPSGQE